MSRRQNAVPNWRPGAALAVLRDRAAALAELRAFFAQRKVLEVETPVLSACGTTDPHIDSLRTTLTGRPPFYLHTSPEFAMKRLLAAGSGDIYQVCRVFRDGESGRHHNPEFTMLEWYRVGWDHVRLMDEVESLVRLLLAKRDLPRAQHLSYHEALRQHAGLERDQLGAEACCTALVEAGVAVPPDLAADPAGALDLVFAALVAPRLGAHGLEFLTGFPAEQAALARLDDDDPALARRFELFLDGIELANGFHELCDPDEQSKRFTQDVQSRAADGLSGPPVDVRLLAALAAGLPDCAGVAVGLDRVLMLRNGLDNIEQVLAFSLDRA